MKQENKYCLCCGEQVPVNKITRDGKSELTCIYCGFVLDVPIEEKKEEEKEAVNTISDCIMTADDAEMTRYLLEGALLKMNLTQSVITTKNGQEFVESFTKRLAENKPVDLVILDLEMPVMGGITAARVMRAMEAKYRSGKIPILFFSAKKCDDFLKKQIALFSPASYVYKGNNDDPAELVRRIDRLIGYLLNKQGPSDA